MTSEILEQEQNLVTSASVSPAISPAAAAAFAASVTVPKQLKATRFSSQ